MEIFCIQLSISESTKALIEWLGSAEGAPIGQNPGSPDGDATELRDIFKQADQLHGSGR